MSSFRKFCKNWPFFNFLQFVSEKTNAYYFNDQLIIVIFLLLVKINELLKVRMGTRSWDVEPPRYEVGSSVYVKASYFDSDSADKYSDHFKNKKETLLGGIIISIHKKSIRVKFDLDGTVSSIKYDSLVKVTDHNKHLIHSGKSIKLDLIIITLWIFFIINSKS